MDPIQALLLQWQQTQDDATMQQLVTQLKAEWYAAVHRFTNGDLPRTEDLLQDALEEKLIVAPAVLAPATHHSPKAWRTSVLKRFLIDKYRRATAQKRDTRKVLTFSAMEKPDQQAFVPEDETREVWGGLQEPAPNPEAAAVEQSQRRRVRAVLPQLNIRYRVAIALRLGMDATAWTDELADALDEPAHSVQQRLVWVSTLPPPPENDDLLRVLYPEGPTTKNRENWRKAIERALAALRKLLDGDR